MGNWDRRFVTAVTVAAASLAFGACAEDTSLEETGEPLAVTTTTRPPLPDGACVARMSDPTPRQGGTETVFVDSHHPSRAVKIAVHYKSKDSHYSGQTDGTGHAEIEFSIGKPTANHPVTVTVDVDGAETCQASFTPGGS